MAFNAGIFSLCSKSFLLKALYLKALYLKALHSKLSKGFAVIKVILKPKRYDVSNHFRPAIMLCQTLALFNI